MNDQIPVEKIVSLAENADYGTRSMAINLLSDLVALGVISSETYAKTISMLRHKLILSQTSLKSSGVYIAKVIGSEQDQYRNIVLVGTTSDWIMTLEELRGFYGSIWLMVFISAEDFDDASRATWDAWIRSVLKNNKAKIEGTFYLTDRRSKELAEAIKKVISDQSLVVELFASPILTETEGLFEREFGKLTGVLNATPIKDAINFTPISKSIPIAQSEPTSFHKSISNSNLFETLFGESVYNTSTASSETSGAMMMDAGHSGMNTVSAFNSIISPAGAIPTVYPSAVMGSASKGIGSQNNVATGQKLWHILGGQPEETTPPTMPGKKNNKWSRFLTKSS